MPMELKEAFKLLRKALNPERAKRMHFWFGGDDVLLIDKVKVPANDIKAANGNKVVKADAVGRLAAHEDKGVQQLRVGTTASPPTALMKMLKVLAPKHGLQGFDVVRDEGPEEEDAESTGEPQQLPVLDKRMDKTLEFQNAQFALRQRIDGLQGKVLQAEWQDKKEALLNRASLLTKNGDFEAATKLLDTLSTLVIELPALPTLPKGTAARDDISQKSRKAVPSGTQVEEKKATPVAPGQQEYEARLTAVALAFKDFKNNEKAHPDAVGEIKARIGQARALAEPKEGRPDYGAAIQLLDRLNTAFSVTYRPGEEPEQTAPLRPANDPPLRPVAPRQPDPTVMEKLAPELDYLKDAKKRFDQGTGKTLQKMSGGSEFKHFASMLEKFEKSGNDKDRAALEQAARAYLAHYDRDLSEKKQQDSAAKKHQAEKALANLRLLDLSDEAQGLDLGNPPWPKDQQDKVRKLHAQVIVTDGRVARLGESDTGNSDSFFLNDPKGRPAYIFKPQLGEAKAHGDWPQGGGAPREKVFSDFNDSMKGLGLDFGIASAVVMEVESDALAKGKLSQERKRVGVVQEAIPNDGNAKNFILDGPASKLNEEIAKGTVTPDVIEQRKRSIPVDDVQSIALLDFITLNGDRNADNILLQGKTNPPSQTRLRPIDAGNALPSRKAFRQSSGAMHQQPARTGKGIGEGNALMQLPQSLEALSPQMLQNIDKLDPKAVADTLRKSNAELQGEMGGKIGEETFRMVERSVEFLKIAAKVKPPPSVNVLGDIYANEFEQVLDAASSDLAKLVPQLVREAQQRSAEMVKSIKEAEEQEVRDSVEFAQLGGMVRLKQLGGEDRLSLRDNLGQLKRLLLGAGEFDQLGGEDAYRRLGGKLEVGKNHKHIGDLAQDFKYLQLGGADELKRLSGGGEKSASENLITLTRLKNAEQEFLRLGGMDAYRQRGGKLAIAEGTDIGALLADLKKLGSS